MCEYYENEEEKREKRNKSNERKKKNRLYLLQKLFDLYFRKHILNNSEFFSLSNEETKRKMITWRNISLLAAKYAHIV
jgi:hypothetical protein